jgi:hypothetical protein
MGVDVHKPANEREVELMRALTEAPRKPNARVKPLAAAC